jgi:hypothetical protein
VFIAAEGRDITEKKAYEREIAWQREELAKLVTRNLLIESLSKAKLPDRLLRNAEFPWLRNPSMLRYRNVI